MRIRRPTTFLSEIVGLHLHPPARVRGQSKRERERAGGDGYRTVQSAAMRDGRQLNKINCAAVTRHLTMVLSLSLIYFCHFEIYHFTRVN